MIILLGETLPGEIFVGRDFRHFSKNSSLSPDKLSPDKVQYLTETQILLEMQFLKVISRTEFCLNTKKFETPWRTIREEPPKPRKPYQRNLSPLRAMIFLQNQSLTVFL